MNNIEIKLNETFDKLDSVFSTNKIYKLNRSKIKLRFEELQFYYSQYQKLDDSNLILKNYLEICNILTRLIEKNFSFSFVHLYILDIENRVLTLTKLLELLDYKGEIKLNIHKGLFQSTSKLIPALDLKKSKPYNIRGLKKDIQLLIKNDITSNRSRWMLLNMLKSKQLGEIEEWHEETIKLIEDLSLNDFTLLTDTLLDNHYLIAYVKSYNLENSMRFSTAINVVNSYADASKKYKFDIQKNNFPVITESIIKHIQKEIDLSSNEIKNHIRGILDIDTSHSYTILPIRKK